MKEAKHVRYKQEKCQQVHCASALMCDRAMKIEARNKTHSARLARLELGNSAKDSCGRQERRHAMMHSTFSPTPRGSAEARRRLLASHYLLPSLRMFHADSIHAWLIRIIYDVE